MRKPHKVRSFAGVFDYPLCGEPRLSKRDYSKTKLELHPKERLKMEMYSSPFIRMCIGIAVLLVSLGMFALMVTPLIGAVSK